MKNEAKPYIGPVRVGPKGQIVIPKEVRDMFGISPGDSLMLLAHPARGIGIMKQDAIEAMAEAIFDGRGAQAVPPDTEDSLRSFAGIVKRRLSEDEQK